MRAAEPTTPQAAAGWSRAIINSSKGKGQISLKKKRGRKNMPKHQMKNL